MTITCTYITHKNKPCILLACPYHPPLNTKLKLLDFVKYSNTHKGWYIPQNKALLQQVIVATEGIATINTSALQLTASQAAAKQVSTITPKVVS